MAVVDTGIDKDHPDLLANLKGGYLAIQTPRPGGGHRRAGREHPVDMEGRRLCHGKRHLHGFPLSGSR